MGWLREVGCVRWLREPRLREHGCVRGCVRDYVRGGLMEHPLTEPRFGGVACFVIAYFGLILIDALIVLRCALMILCSG